MRFALAPTSLRPTRDLERTSTRLPAPAGAMRITTSSLKPNQRVVATASILPAFSSLPTISQPSACAAAAARENACSGGAASSSGRMSGYASFWMAATFAPS